MSNNTEPQITHLAACTETHRCWGASGDDRYEPLSQASDGLRREKPLFRQLTSKSSNDNVFAHHYLVKQLWSIADSIFIVSYSDEVTIYSFRFWHLTK